MNVGHAVPPALRVRPLHFEFRALDPVAFPRGKAANIFRGAFGDVFRRIACNPDCHDSRTSPRSGECAYARLFEGQPPGGNLALGGANPSGFVDRPRPFVLRAASLDGTSFGPGDRFNLGVNLFDLDIPALDHFRRAFEQFGEEGLGPGRPRVELVDFLELPIVEIDLAARRMPVSRIKVVFLTPTELKFDGTILREPEFGALVKRARDRVAGLIRLYQPCEYADCVDYRGIGERANRVRMTASHFEMHQIERRSARTGQRHGLGGFTGEAEFEGDLAEFLPWLEALWWTGVGRLTVWGNGMAQVKAA
jgi:hypothetical protein